MNPDRQELIEAVRGVFEAMQGWTVVDEAELCDRFVDAVLAVLQQDKEPYDGEICGDCGLPVVRGIGSWWHAPDELWNEVCAGSEILCPACFYERALKLGKSVFFVATVCQDKTTEDQVRPCGFKHGVSLDEMAAEGAKRYAAEDRSLAEADFAAQADNLEHYNEDQVVSAEGSPAVDPVSERMPVMALRRHDDGTMDDVVVEDVETVHFEQLSGGHLWLCCYFRNGERVTFDVDARRKNDLVYDVGEMPDDWIDWDDREAGVKPGSDTNRSQDAIDRVHGRAAGSMAEPSEPTGTETTESSEASPQSSSASCGPGGEGERE